MVHVLVSSHMQNLYDTCRVGCSHSKSGCPHPIAPQIPEAHQVMRSSRHLRFRSRTLWPLTRVALDPYAALTAPDSTQRPTCVGTSCSPIKVGHILLSDHPQASLIHKQPQRAFGHTRACYNGKEMPLIELASVHQNWLSDDWLQRKGGKRAVVLALDRLLHERGEVPGRVWQIGQRQDRDPRLADVRSSLRIHRLAGRMSKRRCSACRRSSC